MSIWGYEDYHIPQVNIAVKHFPLQTGQGFLLIFFSLMFSCEVFFFLMFQKLFTTHQKLTQPSGESQPTVWKTLAWTEKASSHIAVFWVILLKQLFHRKIFYIYHNLYVGKNLPHSSSPLCEPLYPSSLSTRSWQEFGVRVQRITT